MVVVQARESKGKDELGVGMGKLGLGCFDQLQCDMWLLILGFVHLSSKSAFSIQI